MFVILSEAKDLLFACDTSTPENYDPRSRSSTIRSKAFGNPSCGLYGPGT
jgi:hypothetical protein